MYTIDIKMTRPNTDVIFYTLKDEAVDASIKQYFYMTYMATGKFLLNESVLSEDGLVLMLTLYWESQEEYTLFQNDIYLKENFYNDRNTYWEANQITYEVLSMQDI
jgi:hypothetical protein